MFLCLGLRELGQLAQGSVCSGDVKCSGELFVFSHISFLLQQKYFKNTSLEFRFEKHIMWQLQSRGRKWHSGAGAASDLPVVLSKAFCSSLTEFACTALPLYLGFCSWRFVQQPELLNRAWDGVTDLDFLSNKVEVVWRACL